MPVAVSQWRSSDAKLALETTNGAPNTRRPHRQVHGCGSTHSQLSTHGAGPSRPMDAFANPVVGP